MIIIYNSYLFMTKRKKNLENKINHCIRKNTYIGCNDNAVF